VIKFKYPKLALERAKEVCRAAEKQAGSQRERDRLCQESVGLTHRYLSRVGKTHRCPSNRTLANLGLELVVRDPRTGQEEKINLREEAPCDWHR
jgi:hypothetical protein